MDRQLLAAGVQLVHVVTQPWSIDLDDLPPAGMVSTADAARGAGVTEAVIRQWIRRGYLQRQPDGSLNYLEVTRVAGERVSKAKKRRDREAWDRFCAENVSACP